MAQIVRYKKVRTEYTRIFLRPAVDKRGNPCAKELCELDGFIYTSIPDVEQLPPQSELIDVEVVDLTEDLYQRLKIASPHIKLINERVIAKIRQRYTADDESKFSAELMEHQLSGSDLPESVGQKIRSYLDYRRACVSWGEAEKKKLGL